LPQYHDMGLIGGVVQPIYYGGSCTLLAPAAFLQRPALWLETIARTRANVSGGPDFAYDLCVRRISAEERSGLDLSSWEIAFTGAERVRADTIERFSSAFADCGFRREAFFPCYGLAEATLMVSGGPRLSGPKTVYLNDAALGRNCAQETSPDNPASRTFVGCGECMPGQKVVIVNPQTRQQCSAGEVGEVWVQGPSVASGYFGQPEATLFAFDGHLAGSDEGPFLRTGDLGFFHGGQLFITGRLKDVIIIRGRNYYPEDIEHSVGSAHPAFRHGCCVAFSIEYDGSERLVVVQGLESRRADFDADAALRAIRRTIANEHELDVYAIVLVNAREIPKTSSGKTQRSTCRQRYLNGQFSIVAHWKANGEALGDLVGGDQQVPCPLNISAEQAEGWLIQRIATRLGLPMSQVRGTTPFLEFGMGSVDAVEIAADLERWLGRRISPTAVYNYPNIAALANWLAKSQHKDELPAIPDNGHISPSHRVPGQLFDDVRSMSDEDIERFIRHEMEMQDARKQATN